MVNYLGALLTGAQQYLAHRKSKGLGILAFLLIIGMILIWEDWVQPLMDVTGVTSFAKAIGLVQPTAVMTFFVGYLLLAVVLYLLCIVIFFVPLVQTIFLLLPQPIQIIIFAPILLIGLLVSALYSALGLKKEAVPVYSPEEQRIRKMMDTVDYNEELPIIVAEDLDCHRFVEYQSLSKAEQAEFDKHDKYSYKANGMILFMRNKAEALTQKQVFKRFSFAEFVPHRKEHFAVAYHKERGLWAILTTLNHGLAEDEVIYQLVVPEWDARQQAYDIRLDLINRHVTNRDDMVGIAPIDMFTDYHAFKGPQFEVLLTQVGNWQMQQIIRPLQRSVVR